MSLRVLAVDDEPPALDELAYLLRDDPRVGEVLTAGDAVSALRLLESAAVDAVFLDIRMPGLDGVGLARVLTRFAAPPALVFVTAYDDAAVQAFDLHAVDYLLKPLRADRLAEAVRRVTETRGAAGSPEPEESVAVELGGVTRWVAVRDVRYVEAAGDYARLHTSDGSHLLRTAMAALEERWSPLGFVRVHRSYLVAAAHISELRVEPGGGHAVRVGDLVLPVSRRHSRELKDRLLRRDGAGR
ncbi:MAG: DNA-binding response regulator [Frankiales bacterium]|nr:DNA-binding response regulator [Frankiales bacterium]